ncbi:hypothetical protein GCM10009678_25720 [Actinomadura kijaniata]
MSSAPAGAASPSDSTATTASSTATTAARTVREKRSWVVMVTCASSPGKTIEGWRPFRAVSSGTGMIIRASYPP